MTRVIIPKQKHGKITASASSCDVTNLVRETLSNFLAKTTAQEKIKNKKITTSNYKRLLKK